MGKKAKSAAKGQLVSNGDGPALVADLLFVLLANTTAPQSALLPPCCGGAAARLGIPTS